MVIVMITDIDQFIVRLILKKKRNIGRPKSYTSELMSQYVKHMRQQILVTFNADV